MGVLNIPKGPKKKKIPLEYFHQTLEQALAHTCWNRHISASSSLVPEASKAEFKHKG